MDTLQFFQIMAMVLSDRPIKRVDAILFHARSFNGDDDVLFPLAGHLATHLCDSKVAINGGNGEPVVKGNPPAWPGREHYIERLRPLGCNVVLSRPAVHTLDEAYAFSELSEDWGWKRAIVIAQPFQLPRIMMSQLLVMGKRNYPMQVYAASPLSVDWNKTTNANQGKAGVSRFEQIEMELERVEKYTSTGELATPADLIAYLLTFREQMGS